MRRLVCGALLALSLCITTVLGQQGGQGGPPQGPLPTRAVPAPHFEYAGPTSAGRIAAAAAVAGKPGVYYAGAASGGVWKSSDGGTTWKPTFDKETSQAIGALAVSQSNPDIVWAGTGEGWAVRDMDMMGDGVYKSTDAGETWTKMGLPETGRIGTIVIHPTNENVVLVCALGRATGPQKERGVFRTEDGGTTWQQALFVDREHGLLRTSDLAERSERRARRHVADVSANACARERRTRAAACTSRTTAAGPSRRSRIRACRNRRSGKWTSLSRRRMATGCTR